jgi:hypothetical protein
MLMQPAQLAPLGAHGPPVEVRSSRFGGHGVFATRIIAKGEQVYPVRRLKLLKTDLMRYNSADVIDSCLAYGWAVDDDVFELPLGVEAFINHAPASSANCRDGVAVVHIEVGDEVLENYADFDPLVSWYVEATTQRGIWTAHNLSYSLTHSISGHPSTHPSLCTTE